MMKFKNDREFEFFAIQNYSNRQCLNVDEFYEDLLKFKYVKRLFRRYRETGEMRERLILNHIIGIYNVFPIPAANRMMFHKIDSDLWPTLKTFLLFLNYIPDNEYQDVTIDLKAIKILQKI